MENKFTLPSHLTVEVWAKSNTATWNSYGFLVSKRDVYILHPYVGTKQISFSIFADGSWREVTYNDPNLDITQWHHYVGTFDGASLNIYVDGVKSSVGYSGTINTVDTGSLYIGWDDGQAGRYFNGYLDDVHIYNRAMPPTEVMEQFRSYSITVPTVNSVTSPVNTPIITLSGTKSANTAIKINGTTMVALDTATTWQGTYILTSGMNNLSISAMDVDGYHSQAVTVKVALDDTAPAVTLTDPVNSSIFNSPVSTITFSLKDAFSNLDLAATIFHATVKKNSGQDVAGAWATNSSGSIGSAVFTAVSPMGEGSYTASITPSDAFGNCKTASLTFTLDMTAPPLPVINPVQSPTTLTTQIVSGAMETGATIIVTCPTATTGNITYPTNTTWSVAITGLTIGNNNIIVTARDAANNSASSSATITVNSGKPGDCDASGNVTIDEVQAAINMYLGLKTPSACVDLNGDGVSIDEVQKVINGYLGL